MENTDNAWVFDSLVGFLHGPVWNVPLQTFIEEKSLPFEPSDNGEVVDRPEYKQVHQEYRDLVDVMLGSFMEDIGITVEQFEAACVMSVSDLAGLPAQFHRRLFDQIWAANDYAIFVKMMTHKNVELQLQALELMGRRLGTVPSILTSDNDCGDSPDDDWVDNDEIMKELHNLQLNETLEDTVSVQPADMMAEKESLMTKMQGFDIKDTATTDTKAETSKKEHGEPIKSKKVEVSEDEMKARQEYLNSQRDKLLALKKQVREKKLDEAGKENGKEGSPSKRKSRPPSARAAAAALAGAAPAPPPSAMQLRRALASKLKAEVVDGKR